MHPYLLHSGHLYVPTFGVLAAVGLMLALTLSLRTAAWVGLSPDALWDSGLFAVLAAFVLSRLLLIATNLHSFLAYPMLLLAVPSLTALGLLLTLIATGVWLWIKRIPMLAALDAWTPCATLTWVFLAVGHFAEGTDVGMPTDSWLGILMPGEAWRSYPVALYAAAVASALTFGLTIHLRHRRRQGDTLVSGLASAGLAQFLLGFLREPAFDLPDSGWFGALDPMQWVAAGSMLIAGILFVQQRPKVAAFAEIYPVPLQKADPPLREG